jgi:hypothetical protein
MPFPTTAVDYEYKGQCGAEFINVGHCTIWKTDGHLWESPQPCLVGELVPWMTPDGSEQIGTYLTILHLMVEVDTSGVTTDFRVTRLRAWAFINDKLTDVTSAMRADMNIETIGNVVRDSLFLLSVLNNPEKFVLESKPIQNRLHPKKILRSSERPLYTILHPTQIRKRMGLENPDMNYDGYHKRPHERRGHYRRFRAERYINVRGKRKWIESTWIGEFEAIVGRRQYKVILDRMGASSEAPTDLDLSAGDAFRIMHAVKTHGRPQTMDQLIGYLRREFPQNEAICRQLQGRSLNEVSELLD